MDRYNKLFKEENSISMLKDETIPEKLVKFIKENPFPTDHGQLHSFAEKLGIESEELEQYAYAFLTLLFAGGASQGKPVKASKENIEIGNQIELEHCKYDTGDNKALDEIKRLIIEKIRDDHLEEDNNYYVAGVNFKDELEKEKSDND